MKLNIWEYVEVFHEMKDVYDNLGLDDNWSETLDSYDYLLNGQVKTKAS